MLNKNHLMGRSKPAKPNTLAVLDKAENRLKDWAGLRVKDLTGNEFLRKFDEIASRARTAAEQTFRWANVAVRQAIEIEASYAQTQQRQPSLFNNPFSILKVQKKFRTRSELEESYRAKVSEIHFPLRTRLDDFLRHYITKGVLNGWVAITYC